MNVNIILYDDFETLDALGIANIFGKAPEHFYINYLSVNGGIVSSRQGVKVWTEILIPDEVEDILVLPGGRTANRLLCLEPNKLKIIKAAAGSRHLHDDRQWVLCVSTNRTFVSQTDCRLSWRRELETNVYS